MYAWRYLDNQYTEDPDFVFNRSETATILITGTILERVLLGF